MIASLLAWAAGALLGLSQAPSREAPPPLPDVHLAAFAAAARHDVEPALADARAHPDDADAVDRLGRVLQAWEQWDAARGAYARSCALRPGFDCFYLEGIVASRQADHQGAAALLQKAVALDPQALTARLHLADALLEAGRLDEAGRIYGGLAGAPAAEPQARYGLGRVAAARGDLAAAVEAFTRATALVPDFGAAWYGLGMAERRLGRNDAARDALEKASRFAGEWPAVPDPLLDRVRHERDDAQAHLSRGIELGRRGDLDGAIREHEAALAADPSLTQADVNLISLCAKAGRYDAAEAHYAAAIRSGTLLGEANYNIGVARLDRGNAAGAADAFHRAVDANPGLAGAWNNLGQLAERAGRTDEAFADYRRAVEASPTDPTMRFNLARMQIVEGRYPEAIAGLERLAAEDHPERARYLFGLATAWIRSGDSARGIPFAREAHDVAVARGQTALAAAIARDLDRLQGPAR